MGHSRGGISNFISILKPARINFNKNFLALCGILILAFGLRFYRLGANELWFDEIFSVIISKSFISDWNPPVYFAFLFFWIKIFGQTEFSLRFPSLIFSVASIPCFFLLAKELFNRRVGIYASLVLALSTFHIWYAQEARPYSLVVFLSIISSYFLFRFLTEKKYLCGVVFAAATILGFYADQTYYYLFLFFAQFIALQIFSNRAQRLKFFLFFCLITVLSYLRLDYFFEKFLTVKQGFWIPAPNWETVVFTFENFNLGYNAWGWLYRLSHLLVIAIIFFGALVLKENSAQRKNIFFIATLLFLPLVLIFIFSRLFFPIYLSRGLIIFSPYYYLLLCCFFDLMAARRFKRLIGYGVLAVLVISLPNYYADLMPSGSSHQPGIVLKRPFKSALRFLEGNFQSGDQVLHTNYFSQVSFNYYALNKEVKNEFLFAGETLNPNWSRPYKSYGGGWRVEELRQRPNRIWVISCDYDRGQQLDDNSALVNAAMLDYYYRQLSVEFDGLWVNLYIPKNA